MKNQEHIKQLISFCESSERLLVSELEGLTIEQKLNPILITAFWMRINELYRGTILLASQNLPLNGFILLRTMTETFILMRTVEP